VAEEGTHLLFLVECSTATWYKQYVTDIMAQAATAATKLLVPNAHRAIMPRERSELIELVSHRDERDNKISPFSKDDENIMLSNQWWNSAIENTAIELFYTLGVIPAGQVIVPSGSGFDITSPNREIIELASSLCNRFDNCPDPSVVTVGFGLHEPGHFSKALAYMFSEIIQLNYQNTMQSEAAGSFAAAKLDSTVSYCGAVKTSPSSLNYCSPPESAPATSRRGSGM